MEDHVAEPLRQVRLDGLRLREKRNYSCTRVERKETLVAWLNVFARRFCNPLYYY